MIAQRRGDQPGSCGRQGRDARAPGGLPPGRVAIIGPGRLGTVLAAGLAEAGHTIGSAGGGGEAARARFRSRFPAAVTVADPAAAVVGADLVVVSTPDDAVESVVTALVRGGAIHAGQRVVHVAGSLGLGPLRRAELSGARVAACHPAQTVPNVDAAPDVLLGASWAVTASHDNRGWAHAFVTHLGGIPHDVADGRRALYHAALVVGSNAVGAAVSVARQLLLAAGSDEPAIFLAGLTRESVDNVLARGAAAITGPVARADVETLRRHLEALEAEMPLLAPAYRALSLVILGQVRARLDLEEAQAVEAALASDSASSCSRPTNSGHSQTGEG
ncbi:MAG: Rossmann-like and DUF2520 domain-containing protein [Nitriliruptorales bacterium]